VPGIRIGNVDGLKRYLVYGLGWWLDWKRPRSTVWVVIGTWHAERDCGWLGKISCVWTGIVVGLERCPECGLVDDC
jgi:hypothetical protein